MGRIGVVDFLSKGGASLDAPAELCRGVGEALDLEAVGGHTTLTLLVGVDGISLFFVILTTFLVPVCLFSGLDQHTGFSEGVLHLLSSLRNPVNRRLFRVRSPPFSTYFLKVS